MKKLRRDILFFAITILIIIIVLIIPSGFEPETQQGTYKVQAEVLKTDNSGLSQYGIIKTGTQYLTVKVKNSRFKGQVLEATNILIGKLELDKIFIPGDTAFIVLETKDEKITSLNVIDHYRINIEIILLAVFILLLILFAGFTGAKAVVSFIFTIVVIWKIMLPLILKGAHPLAVSLAITFSITFIIIFLVGGVNRKGFVAFLGSVSGIILTCIMSIIFGNLFGLHGAVKPFAETLLYSGYPHLDLSSIFQAGIFIASSGAVMDLAMDIAASMKEVADKKSDITAWELTKSGFTIGKVVVGTMTTTLLLAYTGSYTTMLMVFMAQKTPTTNILNIQYVSAEILHTLVGSFGLVSVAPLTALIGGFLFTHYKNKKLFGFIPTSTQQEIES